MGLMKEQEEAKATAQKHLGDKITALRQEMEEMDRWVGYNYHSFYMYCSC